MKVVLSLGGSIVYNDGPDKAYLQELANLLKETGASFAITVGAGKLGRAWVEEARKKTQNNYELDMIAIKATYENASFVQKEIPGSVLVDRDIEQAAVVFEGGKIPVTGGTHPGHTTDTVSVLLVEKLGADRWVNLSNVEAVYDSDPSENPNAKKYSKMTHAQLTALAAEHDRRGPRENFIIDILAAKILQRSNIEAHFVMGKDLGAVKSAILGKSHNGTVVRD